GTQYSPGSAKLRLSACVHYVAASELRMCYIVRHGRAETGCGARAATELERAPAPRQEGRDPGGHRARPARRDPRPTPGDADANGQASAEWPCNAAGNSQPCAPPTAIELGSEANTQRDPSRATSRSSSPLIWRALSRFVGHRQARARRNGIFCVARVAWRAPLRCD